MAKSKKANLGKFKGKTFTIPEIIKDSNNRILDVKGWESDPRFEFRDWRDPSTIVWRPVNKEQWLALALPVFELCGAGNRGGGKSDAISIIHPMMWMLYGGLGQYFRGMLFRISRPELKELADRSQSIYTRVIRGCTSKHYNRSEMSWTMPNGEYFKYKHFRSIEQDGVDIKGTNNAWVGFEELTEWTNLEVYKIAKATLRSVHKNAPNCIRSTTNPDGVGRLPVKDFFRLPENYNRLIELPLVGKATEVQHQISLEFNMQDNPMLDDDYESKLRQSAYNEDIVEYWIKGNWLHQASGFWGRSFVAKDNIIPAYTPKDFPNGYRYFCSFDWGFTSPFAVCWFAISNGTPIKGTDIGLKEGDLICFYEWYGCDPNDTNKGIEYRAQSMF